MVAMTLTGLGQLPGVSDGKPLSVIVLVGAAVIFLVALARFLRHRGAT